LIPEIIFKIFMSVPATSSATSANTTAVNTAITDAFTNPKSALNQTDFLKLLVAQIQYQDPMNPQSDTQMAAQLAQFTALQQASQSTSSLAMMQANSLVGSTVTVQVDSKTTANGVVTGVVLKNGQPQITIDSTNYGLSQVIAVSPPTTNTTNSTVPTPTTAPTPTPTVGTAPTLGYTTTTSSTPQTN
jgi:flagellar basal-body rod modification protein FlgD